MTLSPFRMNTYKKPRGGSTEEVNSQRAYPPSPPLRNLCGLCVSALSFSSPPPARPSLPHHFFTSLLLLVIAPLFPCNLSPVPRYSSTQRQFTANAEMTAKNEVGS